MALRAEKLFERVWLNGELERHLEAVFPPLDPAARPARSVGLRLPTSPGPAVPYTKLAVARACGRVSRASGRGGGTTAPGRLLLQLDPRAIRKLAARLPQGSVLISATNGKTTSARILAAILEADGRRVVHNRAGANFHWGVAAALAQEQGEIGVFEVDEAWLPLVAAEARPRLVVLGNLFRDRLDGYGEVMRLVSLWRDFLSGPDAPRAVVANADDPLLCGPGGALADTSATRVLFGVEDERIGSRQPGHPHEALHCLRCGRELVYRRAYLGHLGHYACPGCGNRPAPELGAHGVEEHALRSVRVSLRQGESAWPLEVPMPGLHNLYNALAATAAALHLGVAARAIQTGLARVRPPFGRSETITLPRGRIQLMLVKNPVGMNETLRLLEKAGRDLHMWLGLSDLAADGRDVSWIWDADFERLRDRVGTVSCSGTRAAELALRLKYAGWASPMVDGDLERSLERSLRASPDTLYVLPTYSVLLGLRAALNRRAVMPTDWGDTARAA